MLRSPAVNCLTLADSFAGGLGVGLLLRVAGASFAAALPLASGWCPPEHEGLAMGIAGERNSGTIFVTLFAPRLAQAYGWRNVFGYAMIPVASYLSIFVHDQYHLAEVQSNPQPRTSSFPFFQ